MTRWSDLPNTSLRSQMKATRDGDLTASDLVEATAIAASSLPSNYNPFMAVDFDVARSYAKELDQSGPADHQPLFGLPMAIKDLEPTKDFPTTYGFATPRDEARRDGSFTERLRSAGAVIYGKTTTCAYGHKDTCDSLLTGVTRNPWNTELTPGGSSGGAAVLVASGVNRVAHGTDASGSVRTPAALCGIVGFKPSFGRLPRIPVADLWAARGHHGFLGRTMDDVRVVMDALSGGDARDPLSPPGRWDEQPPREKRGRVLFVESLFGQEVDKQLGNLFHRIGDILSNSGVSLESRDIRLQNPVPWTQRLAGAQDFNAFGALYRSNPTAFSDTHAALIEIGMTVTIDEVWEGARLRTALYQQATALMDSYDFIITPTLPRTAWAVDDHHPMINGTPTRYGPSGRWPDLLLANLTGWPAISIPCGYIDGLPVGLQVIAPWRADLACLDFAESVESALIPLTSEHKLPFADH